jgi:hypothetical protein
MIVSQTLVCWTQTVTKMNYKTSLFVLLAKTHILFSAIANNVAMSYFYVTGIYHSFTWKYIILKKENSLVTSEN